MSVEDVSKVVTYAANQSDRWLFIAMLAIVLMFAWIVIRYQATQIREQRASHEAQEKENREERKTMAVLLHDATQALREVRQFMERNMKVSLLLLGFFTLTGCANLAGVDRTYSVFYADELGQQIGASASFGAARAMRGAGKAVRPINLEPSTINRSVPNE